MTDPPSRTDPIPATASHAPRGVARAFRPEILDAEANPDLYGLRRSVCSYAHDETELTFRAAHQRENQ